MSRKQNSNILLLERCAHLPQDLIRTRYIVELIHIIHHSYLEEIHSGKNESVSIASIYEAKLKSFSEFKMRFRDTEEFKTIIDSINGNLLSHYDMSDEERDGWRKLKKQFNNSIRKNTNKMIKYKDM